MKIEDVECEDEEERHKMHDCFDHIEPIKAETFILYEQRGKNREPRKNHLFRSHFTS